MGLVGRGVSLRGFVRPIIVTQGVLGGIFDAPAVVDERAVNKALNVARHRPAD